MKTLKIPSLVMLFVLALSTLQSCKKEKAEEINLKDQAFITTAYSKNSFAMQAAILARNKSASADVTAYAEKLSSSSAITAQQMSTLAQSKGWIIPSNLEPKDQAVLDLLNNIDAAAFNKEYAKAMVTSQLDAITAYEQASTEVGNTELKSYVTTNLPVLRIQLDATNNLNAKLP